MKEGNSNKLGGVDMKSRVSGHDEERLRRPLPVTCSHRRHLPCCTFPFLPCTGVDDDRLVAVNLPGRSTAWNHAQHFSGSQPLKLSFLIEK
jgi:hypothetical protein